MPQKTIILIIGLIMSLNVSAQSGLNIARLFDGRYHKNKDATEVLMKGRQLNAYKLSLFRSLTLGPQSGNAATIEPLVKADGRNAIDKEMSIQGGRLAMAFYQLPSRGKTHRYIFYSNSGAGRRTAASKITLIYMEGTATLSELKRTFKK